MQTQLSDRVLDALDDAPIGEMFGEDTFEGPLATIQYLSASLGVSDSSTRRAALALHAKGLARIWDGYDPGTKRRRLYITGEA